MENIKVLQCVKNYLKHIEKQNVNVGESYGKVEQWLKDNCDDKELKSIMRLYVLHRTLQVINKKQLKHIKEAQGNWDTDFVRRCYKRLEELQVKFNDIFASDREIRNDLKSFSDSIEPYCTTKPWMYLYINKVYTEKDFGKWLINPSHQFFKKAEKMLSFEEALAETASE